jgi:hypothetical protein
MRCSSVFVWCSARKPLFANAKPQFANANEKISTFFFTSNIAVSYVALGELSRKSADTSR